MEFWDFGIFPENLIFSNFLGVPEVREGFRKVSRGGMLHSGRIWAHAEPSRPYSPQICMIFDETPSMIFSIFDDGVASTGPGTRLE